MSKPEVDETGLMLAKEYARRHGHTEQHVIEMIRAGELEGRMRQDKWYVDLPLSEEEDSGVQRSPGISTLAKIQRRTGIALVAIAMVSYNFLVQTIGGAIAPKLIVAALFFSGTYLFYRGRQRAAKDAAGRILHDHKADVLYLRPFRTDATALRATFAAGSLGGITEEEQLAEVLRPFGDFVAIGRPGESLPPPGAARESLSDGEWKEAVTSRMAEAPLVVIRAGTGEGIEWELRKATEMLEPAKLLIFIYRMKMEEYERFSRRMASLLPVPLPGEVERTRGRVSGFFRFAENWRPEFLPAKAPLLQRSPFKSLRSSLMYALKPVFMDYGIGWTHPQLSLLIVFSLGAVGLLILGVLIAVLDAIR